MAVRKVIPKPIAAGSIPWTFYPKVKVELVIDDAQVSAAVDAIVKAASTGKIGDGKIFLSKVG